MKVKYKGFYKYDNERIQKYVAHDKTLFAVEITDVINGKFSGNVEDDISTGGRPGVGKVSGEISGDKISFIKQMPVASSFGKGGKENNRNTKHPKIYYSGVAVGQNKFEGRWQIKFGIIFNGLIPIPVIPTSGIWEMEKEK